MKGAIQEIIDNANADIEKFRTEVAQLKRDNETLLKMLETSKKQNWKYKEPFYTDAQTEYLWQEFKKHNKL